ncbi:hypothetical protein TSUD_155160 [Trifolium subterraneum]|uniref:Uncharacterized protein n=1 Tax=Trifolium subterraneum TaxID=3900 RepID=A0A2Z6MIA1_TRISU|nr:hypothetical protein TSUD_155160 [Trifolium subterraneum]
MEKNPSIVGKFHLLQEFDEGKLAIIKEGEKQIRMLFLMEVHQMMIRLDLLTHLLRSLANQNGGQGGRNLSNILGWIDSADVLENVAYAECMTLILHCFFCLK